MTNTRKRAIPVLIADDDPESVSILQMLLPEDSFSLHIVPTAAQAIKALSFTRPRLAFIEFGLSEGYGLEVLSEVREIDPSLDVILMSRQCSPETVLRALQVGAYGWFDKPLLRHRLDARLRKWFESERRRDGQMGGPEGELMDGIVGQSSTMIDLFSRVRRAAPYFSSALVTGDSGTGKELIARALHTLSGRQGPFIVCNCSAIPETLFESQLFGHTKGAFTGATRDEKGFVASAEGGTLFLDEVGELPLSVQPKLLRFLQNGEIQRVGSPLIISTDVRVVAATNRDLANMVNDRGFREDLYYRLAMVQFRVTPLSQRMDDFPQLLRHFLDRYQLEYSKPSLALSARAKRLLQQHSWPGNIRELQHVLAYACMMCTGSVIDLADFPEWWLASLDSTAPLRKALALHDLEQHHIHHVLTECQGNRTRAAKALGIGRATLYRALAKANSPTSQFSNVLVR